MFSGNENCWRIPPTESTVEAWEYCGKTREGDVGPVPREQNTVLEGESHIPKGNFFLAALLLAGS